MLIVLYVDKCQSEREILYRIFCIEPIESLTDISKILALGNLKLIKCIDFWLPSSEITYRANVNSPLELLGKYVTVSAAGGRVLSLEVHADKRDYLKTVLPALATRPVGIRVLNGFASLAISDTLYVTAPCRDENLDLKFFLGQLRELIVGASPKNFMKNLRKLKHASEQGILGRKKISLEADFVVPLQEVLRLLNLDHEH